MSDELLRLIIAACGSLLALGGSMIGIYIKLSTDIALLKQRMDTEETHSEHFVARHQEHDRRINDTVLSIERQLNEIKLLIEQKIK
jgi:hypothetical protein